MAIVQRQVEEKAEGWRCEGKEVENAEVVAKVVRAEDEEGAGNDPGRAGEAEEGRAVEADEERVNAARAAEKGEAREQEARVTEAKKDERVSEEEAEAEEEKVEEEETNVAVQNLVVAANPAADLVAAEKAKNVAVLRADPAGSAPSNQENVHRDNKCSTFHLRGFLNTVHRTWAFFKIASLHIFFFSPNYSPTKRLFKN